MFTPTKIFLLLLTLTVVWFVFSTIEKRQRRAAEAGQKETGKKAKSETVDLSQCDVCGDWTNAACGRPDCANKG